MRSETWRLIQIVAGALLIVVGGPVGWLIPGPFGFVAVGAGLVLILRASAWSRRQFIHLRRRFPEVLGKVERIIRRKKR